MDSAILNGIKRDCDTINSRIGVDKDLILINYNDFDLEATLASGNRETGNTNGNFKGITDIKLKNSATLHIFEGTDFSVIPSVSPIVLENGKFNYNHSIVFTVYSKLSKDRITLLSLSEAKVVAVTKDRSTGLYELFGMRQGLRMSGLDRSYIGSQNSNFYSVTLSTPDFQVLKELTFGELAVSLNGSTSITPTPETDNDMKEVTDLDFEIVKVIGTNTTTLTTTKDYITKTPKVYLNGQRLIKGIGIYDYIEVGTNQIVLNFKLDASDIIIIDYKITV